MAPQIRTYLLNQRRQAARAAFLATLRDKYGVRNFLQEERDVLATTRAASLRQLVESGDAPSLGPAGAPVTVVEPYEQLARVVKEEIDRQSKAAPGAK
jgi:hypothetical protein